MVIGSKWLGEKHDWMTIIMLLTVKWCVPWLDSWHCEPYLRLWYMQCLVQTRWNNHSQIHQPSITRHIIAFGSTWHNDFFISCTSSCNNDLIQHIPFNIPLPYTTKSSKSNTTTHCSHHQTSISCNCYFQDVPSPLLSSKPSLKYHNPAPSLHQVYYTPVVLKIVIMNTYKNAPMPCSWDAP